MTYSSPTQDGIRINMSFCFRPSDCLIMAQGHSHLLSVEDLSFVTFECSVIVRDFVLWGVDRATAPVYRVPWVSLPGPTEVMTMPG